MLANKVNKHSMEYLKYKKIKFKIISTSSH